MNVLHMVECEYRFDAGEGSIVVGDKTYFPLRWIWTVSNDVADFEFVEIVKAREG